MYKRKKTTTAKKKKKREKIRTRSTLPDADVFCP